MAAAAQTSAIAEAVTMTTARGETSAVSNIFAPLDLTNTEDKSVSSHRSKTAPTIYRFICNPLVSAAVSAFQDECVQDLRLADFRAPAGLGHDDALESDFTSRLVSIVGPRLVAILERVLGLRNVVLDTLSPNRGADLRLTSFFRYQAHTASSLPIEVKRYFGTDDSGVDDLFGEENLYDNLPCLEAMCRDVGYRNEANLWYALTQTAYYIQAEKNSNNRGVIFSKDGVILMQRMNDDTVFVSTIMGYTNARPHPVAAITYWIKESIDSPSKTLPSVIPPIPAESTAVAETSTAGARRRRGQPDDANDNDSGPSGSRRRPEKRPRQERE
ncbi:hypothetical protein EV175_002272 [Coemansia sp. RSA 1933]|nr:hypothetical protein EV175_002272 [Coemansia sp. RSA 1933]